MIIWTVEIKELEILYNSFKGNFPELEKELEQLIRTQDANVVMLYSRRCLEVIITDLCENELKRPRKTEPLKGIIDKLKSEDKVPSHIITSMDHLNSLSSYGTHPKDFDPRQVKPVLNNLAIIIEWHLKHKSIKANKTTEGKVFDSNISSVDKDYFISDSLIKPEKSIIVLPFENLSPDLDQEYFSDGLTEEIITDLSHIHDLLVISRSSAMTFKGTKKTIPEIAQAVKVRYVLEGSVRKASNNLRITAQLIDSTTDTHLWAEKYSGTLDDVFDIQEKVSKSIANVLKIKLSTGEKHKIQERSIDNVIAYDYYLRACREIMSFSKERLEYGLNYLQKGIDIIGENAMIYAAIAYVYFQLVNIGIEQEDNIKKAEEFAAKALNIDPESAEAHLVLANLDILNGNLHKAILHINRAHINKPDDPGIMQWFCVILYLVGKTDTAIPMVEKCIKIDPTNSMYYGLKGSLLFFQGHFDLSLDIILKVYKIFPENGMMQFWKSLVLIYNDRLDDCYEFINESVLEPGQDIMAQLTIFLKYVIKGSRDKYTSLLTPDFLNATQMDCQLSSHMAAFYSYIGEKDKSLEWLENAVDRGFINYPFLNEYDKLLNNVRGEEQFKKLMERVKYEWETFKL